VWSAETISQEEYTYCTRAWQESGSQL